MLNPVASIIRKHLRADARLNILTVPTHERNCTNLCKTGHTFWAIRKFPQTKDWNKAYSEVPENYILLDPDKEPIDQLPKDVQMDVVLSQNKFGQFQILAPIAQALHLPLICYEHTLPQPGWPRSHLELCKKMAGHINVFISEYSRREWGWGENEALAVNHGIDTEVFRPYNSVNKTVCLLSVVNDWINRTVPCGYHFWKKATEGLPVKVLGDTPGLSKPAKSIQELVDSYNQAQIFVNTSLVSPIPTALLEAMACGCCPISTNNCMIPEVITHGVNGFLANSEEEMRALCIKLLANPELCKEVGQRARETILQKFSLDVFVNNWNRIFQEAAEIIPYQRGSYL